MRRRWKAWAAITNDGTKDNPAWRLQAVDSTRQHLPRFFNKTIRVFVTEVPRKKRKRR